MDIRFSDGTTSYAFSGNYITPLAYTPTAGDSQVGRVKDQIEVLIKAPDLATQQSVKDAINGWLALARAQQEIASETKIYVEILQNGETEWRRSELLDGRLQPQRGALDGHSALAQEYVIHIERRNWWEWPEEALPIAADFDHAYPGGMILTNGSPTGGISGYGPILCIQGANVKGDPATPVPVRLELTARSAAYTYVEEIFVAHNYFATLDPVTDEHILEGETAISTSGNQADALARGGMMNRFTWGGPLTDAHAKYWVLTPTLLAGLAGRWYRILVRMKGSFTEPLFGRFRLFSDHYTGTTDNPLAETEEVALGDSATYDIVDFGAIQLPTFVSSVNTDNLRLVLSLRTNTAGQIDIDFAQLSPVDSFHHAVNVGLGNWFVKTLIIDGRLGRTYALERFTDQVVDGFSTISPQPMLWPGRDQWMAILFKDAAQSSDIFFEWDALAYYRPRRLTV